MKIALHNRHNSFTLHIYVTKTSVTGYVFIIIFHTHVMLLRYIDPYFILSLAVYAYYTKCVAMQYPSNVSKSYLMDISNCLNSNSFVWNRMERHSLLHTVTIYLWWHQRLPNIILPRQAFLHIGTILLAWNKIRLRNGKNVLGF